MGGAQRRNGSSGRVSRGLLLGLGLVVAAGCLAWWGVAGRARALTELTEQTHQLNTATVAVVRPKVGAPEEEVVLPGSLQAYTDAPIYARTNGYLRRRLVDMGARVKAGQLLAEIDAPELEQQLQQARADLATAEANLRLARITADRYRDLVKTESVTQQDADNAAGALEARVTAVDSARHNVQRLEQLEAFTRIYAPFDGVITARNTDIGALIDPGSAGGPARELFHVASIGRLRVFVNVPETYSQVARKGLPAKLTLAEFPGRSFTGSLVRTSEAIEPISRTLLAEIDVDNASGELLPGAYAQVHLQLPRATSTCVLPVNTLIFRGEGMRVALVRHGVVEMVPITIGRDFGTEIEVLTGVPRDALVVVNPPDSLVDKQTVRIFEGTSSGGTGSGPTPGKESVR